MRAWPIAWRIGALALCLAGPARADCGPAEFETAITGRELCLVMHRFGASAPRSLVVWVHGDLPDRSPAAYHVPLARQTAERFAEHRVMAVALVRPGYPDGAGRTSEGTHLGRSDHHTAAQVDELAGALARLRARFDPRALVLVGHGGGAAMAATLLGRHPRLADAALLLGCPCDLAQWRLGRRYWGRSEDPMRWAHRVPRDARVVAITADGDTLAWPSLAQGYVEALRARDVEARFVPLPRASHAETPRAPEVMAELARLIDR